MPSWKADSGSRNMEFPALEHSLSYLRSPSNGPDVRQMNPVNYRPHMLISFSLSLGTKSCLFYWGFSLMLCMHFSFPSWLLCCRFNYIQQVDHNFVLSTQLWKTERNGSAINQMKRKFVCTKRRIVFWLNLTVISQFYKFKKVKLVLIMDDKLGRM